jgi:hypothetical protein
MMDGRFGMPGKGVCAQAVLISDVLRAWASATPVGRSCSRL